MPEPAVDLLWHPPMVLLDRRVGFVDQVLEIIEESGGVPLDRSIASALEALSPTAWSKRWSSPRQRAIDEEIKRYRAEVLLPALAILRERKGRSRKSSVLIREPLPEPIHLVPHYLDLLDSIEPCFSHQLREPPVVTRLSLDLCWPPGHQFEGRPCTTFVASGHRYLLVLYAGGYRPLNHEPGFYLVYNAWANSVAIVPPFHSVHDRSHRNIGGPGVASLCLSKGNGDYILVELFLRREAQDFLGAATNTADLFIWESWSRLWVQREVLLPLPPTPPAAQADDDDEQAAAVAQSDADDDKDKAKPTFSTSFHADMVFAVSSTSLCWVDLHTGVLVYNHTGSHRGREFHFIPLPQECAPSIPRSDWQPDAYRSMCCIDRHTLKFVCMDDSYKQDSPIGVLTLKTWTLKRPLTPTNWKWKEGAVSSFRIRDAWETSAYKATLKLQPLMPSRPVISTRDPAIIYLSAIDYDCNHSPDEPRPVGFYVLTLNMDSCRVESVCKVPSYGEIPSSFPHPMIFTSDFTTYLNKGNVEGLRAETLADEGQSRSNPSTPYPCHVEVRPGMLKLPLGGLGARHVISTPGTAPGPSSRPLASSFYPVGLQVALDIASGQAV